MLVLHPQTPVKVIAAQRSSEIAQIASSVVEPGSLGGELDIQTLSKIFLETLRFFIDFLRDFLKISTIFKATKVMGWWWMVLRDDFFSRIFILGWF